MNKKELLKKVDSLNLDKDKYCIIASGALLMYGLVDSCSDVDLRVTESLFNELQSKYNMNQSDRYDYVFELEEFDINCKNFSSNDIRFVEGYPVESLERQLKWMLENKRDKDKEKIIIIQKYLDNRKGEIS